MTVEVLASVDIVAFRVEPVERRLQVLLHLRDRQPHEGEWALPGVIVNGRTPDNTLAAAADRALAEKARVRPQYLEQVGTEGNAFRDPRGWSMSTFYMALLAPDTVVEDRSLRFFDIGEITERRLLLPFDHNLLVRQACERLASKSLYSSLPLYLLATRFTVADALAAAEACLCQPLNGTSLRKRLERMREEGWVQDTGEKNFPRMGRPQQLYTHTPRSAAPFLFDRSLLATGGG